MKKILIFCSISLITCRVYSQDSITLFFNNEKFLLSTINRETPLEKKDSLFTETIFYIGGNKFLYLKRLNSDTLPVELGQLGMYLIDNKPYLFREGIWVVEESKEKVLFGNSGKAGMFLEEYPVSLEPIMMDSKKKRNRKRKKIRTAVTRYQYTSAEK